MDSYYTSVTLAKMNRLQAQERAEHYQMAQQAMSGRIHRPWAKLLVKLAEIMIRTGERLKNNAERDLKDCFRTASLQDL
jgi:hypothetical protein